MPVIPQYKPHQISRQAMPGPRQGKAPIDAFGAVTMPDLAPLADSVDLIARKQRERELGARVREMDMALGENIRAQQSEYFALSGKDAYYELDTYKKRLEETRRDVGKQAAGDAALADLYDRMAHQRIQATLSGYSRHAATGLAAWETGASRARAETFADDAMSFRSDPAQVEARIKLGESEIAASSEGEAPEEVARKQAVYRSKIHARNLAALADENPDAANDYFARFGPQILGDDHRVAAARVTAARGKGEAYRWATDLDETVGRIEDRRRVVRDSDRPVEVKQAAEARLEILERQRQEAKRADEIDASGRVFDAFERGARQQADLPVGLWERLSTADKARYHKIFADLRKPVPKSDASVEIAVQSHLENVRAGLYDEHPPPPSVLVRLGKDGAKRILTARAKRVSGLDVISDADLTRFYERVSGDDVDDIHKNNDLREDWYAFGDYVREKLADPKIDASDMDALARQWVAKTRYDHWWWNDRTFGEAWREGDRSPEFVVPGEEFAP